MNTEQITPENLEAVNASDNLMWYHTPQDFLDAITSKYPCPALSSHTGSINAGKQPDGLQVS